jgi:hypothetical protein
MQGIGKPRHQLSNVSIDNIARRLKVKAYVLLDDGLKTVDATGPVLLVLLVSCVLAVAALIVTYSGA